MAIYILEDVPLHLLHKSLQASSLLDAEKETSFQEERETPECFKEFFFFEV